MSMFRRRSQLLQPFLLDGIRQVGSTVGDGSYATVVPLSFRGLKCAGKKLHAIFFENASPQEKEHMIDRFQEECQLLSCLKHPNIVQFLGVHFEDSSDLPVLVMEFLHCTLSECVDRYGVLPEQVGMGILDDVATGLCYLHGHRPPIAHRDLSANNVLLSSDMKAKISDLGVAKILNLTPASMSRMTMCPGTLSYMPPEALRERPGYDNLMYTKLDCFSVGVMILHVLCGRWPYPSEPNRVDPNNRKKVIGLTEVERREEYFQQVRGDHPLVELIHDCLDNDHSQRPDAERILNGLRQVSPPTSNSNMDFLTQAQSQTCDREGVSKQVEMSAQNEFGQQREVSSEVEQTSSLVVTTQPTITQPPALQQQQQPAEAPPSYTEVVAILEAPPAQMTGRAFVMTTQPTITQPPVLQPAVKPPQHFLYFSVITAMLCGVCSFFSLAFTIPAVIFSIMSVIYSQERRYSKAEIFGRTASCLTIAGIFVGFLGVSLYLIPIIIF